MKKVIEAYDRSMPITVGGLRLVLFYNLPL